MSIFVTSDWHFCHNKEFLYEPRGFSNIWDMNKALVENYNSVVTEEDHVFVLGDLMLNDNETALKYIKQLRGNLHIIQGNHDTDNRVELYKDLYNVREICGGRFLRYGKYHFYLSHYFAATANFDDEKTLHSRMISLCGHTHTKDKFADWDKGISYHCEVDAHNLYPVNIEQVIIDLQEKWNQTLKEKR